MKKSKKMAKLVYASTLVVRLTPFSHLIIVNYVILLIQKSASTTYISLHFDLSYREVLPLLTVKQAGALQPQLRL